MMRNDSTTVPTSAQQQQRPPNLVTLLAGLTVADLHVRRAVQQAEQHGLEPNNPLAGLFIAPEQVAQLLNKSFGQPVWANGHHTPQPGKPNWETALEEARRTWRQQAQLTPNSPLNHLIARFSLSQVEAELLLLALLPTFDPAYGRIFAYLHDDLTRKRPSTNLLLDLLAHDLPHKLELRKLLGENGRLRHHHLLTLAAPDSQPNAPFLEQTVQPAASISHFLLGECQVEIGQLEQCQPEDLRRLDQETFSQIQRLCQKTAPLITLIGAYGSGRREAAQQIAAWHGGWLLTADLATLANDSATLPERLASLLRDGRLHAATLYLQNWHTLLQDGLLPQPIWQALQSYPHPILVASRQPWQPRGHLNGRPIHYLHLPNSDFPTRHHLWQQHLGSNSHSAARLANLFRFTPGQIEDVVATAHNIAASQDESLGESHLLIAARLHSNQRLSQLATAITPRHGWDEIILPADTLAQLHELVQRVQHQPTVYGRWQFDQKLSYGKGVTALFVGESGTGKTMAADIIAGELGLDLYKIDLSAVVSKYIGETEKNLERIFREAETSNAILFFDEADAIFGKRGEVKDSHDRYANLEVSYLLQRLERFEGITILASNLQTNIDDAFTRRLDFIIEFPFPQPAERAHIWQVSLPAALPLAEAIDWQLLAHRFELAGGNIRNAVLGAAFLAAAEGSAVSQRHFLHATRRELQKLGRLIDESLFAVEGAGGA
ncbi:MAG: ATP-binding protein [Chloroflexota bacterium]